MSAGEVVAKIEQIKQDVGKAPYAAAAESLVGLTVTGLDEVEAGLAAMRDRVKEKMLPNASSIQEIGQKAENQFAAVTDGWNSDNQNVLNAIGGLTDMEAGAGLVVANGAEMDSALDRAFDHVAGLRAALGDIAMSRAAAEENLKTSLDGAGRGVEAMSAYQASIAAA